MARRQKKKTVFACSANDYEVVLFHVYRRLFSPLLEKSLDFYKWFYTHREPTCIYDSHDIDEVLNLLRSGKPADIDSLAELLSGFCIADAIVVKDAIQWRLNRLGEQTDTMQIARNDFVEVVIQCIERFRDEIE